MQGVRKTFLPQTVGVGDLRRRAPQRRGQRGQTFGGLAGEQLTLPLARAHRDHQS